MRLLLAVLSFAQWPSASSTALAPGGSDVMLFTAPPDELVFPMTGPDSSERTDLPCDDGPYILDLCDCGEGLGSSFKSHKTALTYATALRAKYIDLPIFRGTKVESAEPVPDDANVRRANAAAAEPPRRTKKDIYDDHDKLNYSPFFGLGSARCNAASLHAHRAAATGHLTFIDAVQQQIEPQSAYSPSPTSNVHLLCARLESGLGGVDRPSNELFDTDPTLSHVSTELGGHTQRKLGKLVLVFSYEFRHVDLNFCAISPEFRQRWRTVQHLEARPRSLAGVPTSERVIAVHFRWGDTATTDVNHPNSVGTRTAPLSELAKVATDVRRKLGGAAVRVLLFTEEEWPRRGRSDAEVAAEFDAFTKAVPNTELRLGNDTEVALNDAVAGGSQTTSTPQDLMDMAQADVLIGGSSSFFELAAHLSEGVVFTDQPNISSWWTAAGPSSWSSAWGPQPNVTQRHSRWGKHIQFVGFDASGPEVVYDGAWWDAVGGTPRAVST
jgi:hypothetical protein